MTLGRVWVLRREMAIAPADPVPDPKPTSTPSPSARSTSSRPAASRPSPVALQLRIPDLGITQTTRSYPCDRVQPPANYVYRWGCAGTNNLYLLGHAYSVFKPLHDAYAKGRIRVGMAAYWTNSKGRRITYRVTAWRLVRPDDPGWAIASQPVPSMTLQTCYGADNEYRLVVRLVAG
jgi:sortase (surface protein transpeptidase)